MTKLLLLKNYDNIELIFIVVTVTPRFDGRGNTSMVGTERRRWRSYYVNVARCQLRHLPTDGDLHLLGSGPHIPPKNTAGSHPR